MGMSASQMRYTLLSGKKSDVEYQGQQINQQRTTLATESSALNTQLLSLNVPTPPSSDSFTKTNYSFSLNSNSCNITGTTMEQVAGAYTGKYTINYTYDTTGDAVKTGNANFYKNTSGYAVGSSLATATNLTNITNVTDANEITMDNSNLKSIYSDYPATGETYYKYAAPDGTFRYIKGSALSALDAETNPPASIQREYSYIDEGASITQPGSFTGASITWTDSGRMSSFKDSSGNVYSLNVSSKNDESAYSNAMNEYEYQKSLYEQNMNNINSKIDIIQSDDKKLELQLQNLDTQQKAVSTEMDSVKKVIDKNIEASFKAFA